MPSGFIVIVISARSGRPRRSAGPRGRRARPPGQPTAPRRRPGRPGRGRPRRRGWCRRGRSRGSCAGAAPATGRAPVVVSVVVADPGHAAPLTGGGRPSERPPGLRVTVVTRRRHARSAHDRDGGRRSRVHSRAPAGRGRRAVRAGARVRAGRRGRLGPRREPGAQRPQRQHQLDRAARRPAGRARSAWRPAAAG